MHTTGWPPNFTHIQASHQPEKRLREMYPHQCDCASCWCVREAHKRSRLLSLAIAYLGSSFWFKSLEESGTLAEVKAPRLALEKRVLEESESEKRGFLILLAYGLKKRD